MSEPTEEELISRALGARHLAYAPYSGFQVGAVLVTATGETFEGANIENASYGLALCAERAAVARMVLDGGEQPRAIYVASQSSPPASPCGMCRQVLLEFADDPSALKVVAVNTSGERVDWTLAELIPAGFTGKQLS